MKPSELPKAYGFNPEECKDWQIEGLPIAYPENQTAGGHIQAKAHVVNPNVLEIGPNGKERPLTGVVYFSVEI